LLPELSPANGVLTPGEAGFRAADFLSDRNLESSMLRSRDAARFDYIKTLELARESLWCFVEEYIRGRS